MPWSAAERARHEGYALAEAEKAIRSAQAEAQASAGAVAKAELERVAALPVAPAEAAIAGLRSTIGGGGVAVGPAEAAAIAAFTTADRATNTATDEALVRRPSRRRARGLELESSNRRTVRSASPRRRNAQVATAGWGF